MGWEYQAKLQQHESQTDHTKGFGGKFGVQDDRQDKVYVVLLSCLPPLDQALVCR